jgi:3-oxoacyl-[acyl-carrier protein] reductase
MWITLFLEDKFMDSGKKIAVVTGGAQGIGKAISEKLNQQGCKVIVIDVNEQVAKETAEELNGEYYIADVSSMESVSGVVDKVIEKDGKIDILINNAGITRDNLMVRMEEDSWDKVIEINLTGVFNFSKQVIKKSMMKKRTGVIVNNNRYYRKSRPGELFCI